MAAQLCIYLGYSRFRPHIPKIFRGKGGTESHAGKEVCLPFDQGPRSEGLDRS